MDPALSIKDIDNPDARNLGWLVGLQIDALTLESDSREALLALERANLLSELWEGRGRLTLDTGASTMTQKDLLSVLADDSLAKGVAHVGLDTLPPCVMHVKGRVYVCRRQGWPVTHAQVHSRGCRQMVRIAANDVDAHVIIEKR